MIVRVVVLARVVVIRGVGLLNPLRQTRQTEMPV
jgi:hypothetical protein